MSTTPHPAATARRPHAARLRHPAPRLDALRPLLICIAAGLAFGLVFPRGPLDGPAVVATVLGGLLAGALAGRCAPGRRWPLLVVAWAASELVRFPYGVPLADLPAAHLLRGSEFAAGALLLGRAVDLLAAWLPLGVGLRLGRRASGGPAWSRPAAVIAGLLVAASLVPLAPTSTPPIPGGVAEIATVRVRGCDHRILLRGASADNPVVFFLSGGPGISEIGALRRRWGAIEREFTVAAWDQTGAGLNGRCWPGRRPLTLDSLAADGAAALEYVTRRFGRRPIVVGHSWGSILGPVIVQRRPDLVTAYVGTGQMAHIGSSDQLFYDDTLAWARADGRRDVVQKLEDQGRPPYASIYPYETLYAFEHAWNRWGRDPEAAAAADMTGNVWDLAEFDLMARVRTMSNQLDTLAVLYPAVPDLDLRREVNTFEVPVFVAAGVHEARGRRVFVQPWVDAVRAPRKELVVFERSGHGPHIDEPDAFLALLRRAARS